MNWMWNVFMYVIWKIWNMKTNKQTSQKELKEEKCDGKYNKCILSLIYDNSLYSFQHFIMYSVSFFRCISHLFFLLLHENIFIHSYILCTFTYCKIASCMKWFHILIYFILFSRCISFHILLGLPFWWVFFLYSIIPELKINLITIRIKMFKCNKYSKIHFKMFETSFPHRSSLNEH